jgi:predicted amidohydrolase
MTLENVFRTIAPVAQRMMQTTASELAARFGVYLMPGTTLTADLAAHLFNTAYIYGSDGQLIGKQDKLHPTRIEVDWLTCGGELEVWSLPFGVVAAPVCMDFTYWETARVAVLRGPSVIAAPLGLLDGGRHLLAKASSADGEEVIVAELDLERLREFRREHALEFNRALYEKYLPQAYEEYRARRLRDGRRIVKQKEIT